MTKDTNSVQEKKIMWNIKVWQVIASNPFSLLNKEIHWPHKYIYLYRISNFFFSHKNLPIILTSFQVWTNVNEFT